MLHHATIFPTTIQKRQHQPNLLLKGHLLSKVYNYSLTTAPATFLIRVLAVA